MKEVFINGVGCISPQLSFDGSVFLPEIKEHSGNKIFCVEPDYTPFFDNTTLRRMSRLIKMAVGASFVALQDGGIKTPGAISTGTGFGLLENSGKFLKSVIEQDESTVSPTLFIQSTHNTIGGIIALMTGCYAHNNTFSHKGLSFESALTDARMVMDESGVDNFLVGGFDELTEYSLAVMSRLNILRQEPCSNLALYKNYDGIIAGEGASFFVLSNKKSTTSYCTLADHSSFLKPENAHTVKNNIINFLGQNALSMDQIDIVLTGLCGDKERDATAKELNESFFSSQTIAAYKHLCGEYMTSSSFACWLAAKILKTGHLPETLLLTNRDRKPGNILIYNTYKDTHSLILFRSC